MADQYGNNVDGEVWVPAKPAVGSEEWAVCHPSVKGGEPDRVTVWDRADMRTREQAEEDLKFWIDKGAKAYLVSRQWVQEE